MPEDITSHLWKCLICERLVNTSGGDVKWSHHIQCAESFEGRTKWDIIWIQIKIDYPTIIDSYIKDIDQKYLKLREQIDNTN